MTNETTVLRDAEHGFEGKDLSLKVVLVTIGILVGGVVVCAVLLHPIFRYDSGKHHLSQPILYGRPSDRYAVPETFPEPRLQYAPKRDLTTFRQAEDRILGNYGWSDKERGLVRVPIDRAIDLLLERGLPTREGGRP